MTNYSYTDDIPNAPNDPSVDQPKMFQNNNNISLLIDEDHFGFNQNNGGFHAQMRVPNQLAIPVNLISASSTIYTKPSQSNSQIFSTPGTAGNEYQLTTQSNDATQFSLFGTNTKYQTIVVGGKNVDMFGGWTFLPGNGGNASLMVPLVPTGGIILQYGSFSLVDTNKTYASINFPIPFSSIGNIYSVTATIGGTTGFPFNLQSTINMQLLSNTQFTIRIGSANSFSPSSFVYWTALGIK